MQGVEIVLLWVGIGVIRYFVWESNAKKSGEIYATAGRVLYFLLFCALGPLWLVSILKNL